MKFLIHARMCLCLALAMSIANSLCGREWHQNDGTLLANGKLLSVNKNQVTILTDDGRKLPIALDELCLEDAAFVEEAIRGQQLLLGKVKDDRNSSSQHPNQKSRVGQSTAKASKTTNTSKAEFPPTDPNVTLWQAHADPGKFAWTKPIDPTVLANVPAADPSNGCLIPDAPSPYVAIAADRENDRIWDRFDLRTGQRDGAVRGAPRENGIPAISPDGKMLAVVPMHDGKSVEIWSFETGTNLSRIDIGEGGYPARGLAFVADRGLLLQDERRRCAVFDAITENRRTMLPSAYFGSNTRTAISPGGHYVAVFQERPGRLGVLDTRNGAVAGDALTPNGMQDYRNCGAIGFSADGSRVWVLTVQSRERRLIGWNLADGSIAVNVALDAVASTRLGYGNSSDRGLDFLEVPEVGGLLIKGRMLVDAKSGKLIWERGASADMPANPVLRMVGKSQMLVLGGGSERNKLAVLPIPLEEIKASRKLIEAGGTPLDVGLPALAQPDWSNVERNAAITGSSAKYAPSPTAPVKALDRLRLESAAEPNTHSFGHSMRLAGGSSPFCALLYATSKNENGAFRASAPQNSIDAFDLTSGQRIASMPLPRAVSILDVSADGSLVAISSTDDGRVDVWDVAAKKHLYALRPSGSPTSRPAPTQFISVASSQACIISNERLLTHNYSSGELILFDRKAVRPVYSRKTKSASTWAFDSNRKHVVVQDDAGVRLCLIDSGEALATLPAEGFGSDSIMTAAAFRSDGTEVAMTFDTRIMSRLVIWKIASENVEVNMLLPFTARTTVWSGPDVLLGFLTPRFPYGTSQYNRAVQRPSTSPNYERQYPDPTALWPPEKLRSIVRVSPAERKFVWTYGSAGQQDIGRQGWQVTNGWQVVGQTAGDCAWLSYYVNGQLTPALISIPDRTPDEGKAIQQPSNHTVTELKGENITIKVDVAQLPEVIARADQRREEFRTSLEASLKNRLSTYTLKLTADKPVELRATIKECPARDLLASDGKTPVFNRNTAPSAYPIAPRGPESLGVLARIELRAKRGSDGSDADPLWLSEAWFYEDSSRSAATDRQSEQQMLVPWERAVRWLDERHLPDNTLGAAQFKAIGSTELPPPAPAPASSQ